MTHDRLRCPICDSEFDRRFTPAMPFCSERCQRIDLGRWLDEDYGLPVEREFDDDTPGDSDDYS